MGLLSWQINERQITIVLDHVKDSGDATAGPARIRTAGNVSVIEPSYHPNDSGRLIINQYGLVFCLLKSKADEIQFDEDVLSIAATAPDLFQLRKMPGFRPPEQHPPYQFVVFPGAFTPLQWQWDGQRFEEIVAPFPVITCPAFSPSAAEKKLLRRFRNETGGFIHPLSVERQLALHREYISAEYTRLIRIRLETKAVVVEDYTGSAESAGNPANTLRLNRKTSPNLTRCFYRVEELLETGRTSGGNYNRFEGGGNRSGGDGNRPCGDGNRPCGDGNRSGGNGNRSGGNGNRPSGDDNRPSGDDNRSKTIFNTSRTYSNTPGGEYNTPWIDLGKVLRDKNPALFHRIPSWVLAGIKRLVKENMINEYLDKINHLPCNFIATNILNHLGVRAKLQPGSGPLPDREKRLVFLSNHPTGGLDGLLLLSWLTVYYPDLKIIVNDLLWNVPHIRPWIIPVDIYGNGTQSAKTVIEAFRKPFPLLIFPAGRAARKTGGVLKDSPWEKNPVKLAQKFDRHIVPVNISGYNSRLFNVTARIRRISGIKWNLELLLLSRALIYPACKLYGITVGSPISPEQLQTFGNDDLERTIILKKLCESLASQS